MLKINDNGFGLGKFITEFNNLAKTIPNAKDVISIFNEIPNSTTDWEKLSSTIGTTDKHMLAYLKTTKAGEATVGEYNSYIKSLGKSFDFAALKLKVFNIALNVGVMAAVSLSIQAIIKLIEHKNELRKEALSAANALDDETNSLTDNKKKISELKTELDSGNLSQQEAFETRSELLSIQKELVKQYGDEASGIDLVNGSLKENIDLLNTLSDTKAKVFLRENRDALDDAATYVYGSNSSDLRDIDSIGSDSGLSLAFTKMYQQNDELLEKEINSILEKRGLSSETEDGYVIPFTFKLSNKSRSELLDVVSEIYDAVDDSSVANKTDILSALSGTLNSVKNETYKESDQLLDSSLPYVLSTHYSEAYNNILQEQQKFNDAVASNDQKAINETIVTFRNAQAEALNSISDNDTFGPKVREYFEGITDDYASVFASYDFKEAINNNSSLKNAAESLVNVFAGSNTKKYTEEQSEAFAELSDEASKYNLSAAQVEQALVDLGYMLPSLGTTMSNTTLNVSELVNKFSELQESYDTLAAVQKEFKENGELSSKTLNDVIQLVPEAITSMDDLGAVIEMVKKRIGQQEDVALTTYGNIVVANQDAINRIINASSLLPSSLATYYGTDFQNFVKNADGKYKVEAQTVAKLSQLWSRYAGISAGAMDAQINNMARAGAAGLLNSESEQIMKDMILYRDLSKSIEESFKELTPDFSANNSKKEKTSKDDPWLEAYKKEYEELNHLRETDQITQQEYYDRLSALDKKYFEGKDKYISEHRKNLEELYKLQKTIFNDSVNDAEHEIAILSRTDGTELQQIEMYKDLQKTIHEQANRLREMGFAENSDQIQELQKKYWELEDNIVKANESIVSSIQDTFEKNLAGIQHDIDGLSRLPFTENQQLSLYQKMRDITAAQILTIKSMKLENEDDLIMELESKERSLADNMYSINKAILDKRLVSYESYIEATNKYGKWGSDNEIAALNRAKAEIEDYYRSGKIAAKDYYEYIEKINKDIADSTDNLYQKYRDTMVSKVDSQIDELNKKLDEQNEIYDQQIEALEKEKDLMREQADEADRLLKIEELRMALEKAKSQKNAQIYREGLGIVYEVDEDAVREAQNALNDELAKDELRQKENEIDKQIQDLEDLKDANEKSIKAQIDNLEKLKDEWEKSLDIELEVEDFEGVLKGLTKFEQDEFGTRLENVTEFRKAYLAEMAQITAAQGSSFATSDGNTYYAGMDGSAPKNAQIGDNILTGGGTYRIVAPGTEGSSYNPNSGFYSVKIDDLSTAITTQNENTVLQTSAVKSNTTAASNSKNTIDKSNTLVDKGNTLTDINNTSVGKNTNELDNNSDELSSLSYGVYLLTDAITNMPEPSSDSGSSDVTTGESHTGGIVGGKGYHEELIDLAKTPLKPNESIRILEKGEGIFTSGMMDNIISMINTPTTLNTPNLAAITPKNIQPLPIDMTIQANFPNVSSESEIKKALMSLPQVAVQYINRS